jgi:hypothetical protein
MGLLPGETNKEILKAWGQFAALPELQMVLKPLSLDAKMFMIAVAVIHLVIAVVIVLPSGPWGTRIAGLWAMVSMLGAEYCTRQTSFVPAGFPKEYKFVGSLITTSTHLFLFVAGFFMVYSKYNGGLIVMLNKLLVAAKPPPAEPSSPTKSERGRSSTSPESKKRDSTPKPSAKKASSPKSAPSKKK